MTKLRRPLAALIGCSFLLTGCGGDELPNRADFISQVKEEMGSDVSSSLTQAGIKSDKAEEILDNFIGCIYDEIKDDEDLLREAYDNGGDSAVETKIQNQAKACTTELTTAVTNAATGG